MARLEKLSESCQGEKINVWPGPPGNWDQPPSTPHMQTRSYIPRPSPVLLSSSPVVHELPVRAHLQVKSEGTFLHTQPFVWPPFQKSHPDRSSSVFIYLICSGNLSFLHRSNHSLPPPLFLTKTPAVIKLSIPLLIPLTGRSIPAPSCLLPLLLSSHLAIHLFLHPSLTLDIYPHFSTPHNWCIWRRGPPRLSPSLPLHPSAVSYPRRLSSSRFPEADLLLVLFSLSWVNTEDSAELPADLLFSICWGRLAGFALLCFAFFFFIFA